MSVSTAVSRVTGFARTWAMGYALGVTALSASYTVANVMPNMIFELVAGGVLSSAFIPLFIERLKRDGDDEAWRFASTVFNIAMLSLGLVALVATVWAEPFARTQTFRSSAADAELIVWFFRFFAVQIVFYGAGAIITGVLNSYRSFLAPAIAPVFNNLIVIVTLLGFYIPLRDSDPYAARVALAVGTTLGVVAMMAVQIPALTRLKVRYTPRIDWRHPALRAFGQTMWPAVIYTGTNLVAVSFRNSYAIASAPEGPAVLAYAWNFFQLPYGIFAVALATAIFPELATLSERGDMKAFARTFATGLRTTFIVVAPLAALLIALAGPVIRLYRAGAFTAEDVPVVAGVLVWWAAGLLFYAGMMFVLKTFYSLKDTRTPMITNAVLTVGQIGGYALLTTGVAGWPGIGLRGIPVADGVFYLAHLTVLTFILRKRIGSFGGYSVLSALARTVLASALGAVAGSATYAAAAALGESGPPFLARLLAAGLVGLLAAYGSAAALRVPEVAGLVRRVRARVSAKRESR